MIEFIGSKIEHFYPIAIKKGEFGYFNFLFLFSATQSLEILPSALSGGTRACMLEHLYCNCR